MPFVSNIHKHVIFDMNPRSGYLQAFQHNQNIILCRCSASRTEYRSGLDVAFPASAIVQMNRGSVDSNRGTYLLTFRGVNSHPVRERLSTLHDGEGVIIDLIDRRSHFGSVDTESVRDDPCVADFSNLLLNSRFALVPRGDALFSYRLLETMAAGAIPVVFSDGWVLPFSEFLDYSSFAVRIDESEWNQTIEILSSYDERTVLRMRRRALDVYHRCFSSIRAQIDTLLMILTFRQSRQPSLST